MGKSPHRGGAGPLFPEACSGIPGEGHGPQGTRGPEGHGGQGKEGRRPESAATHGGYFGMWGGRRTEDTGMCRLMLSPQNKDSLPAADRACGLRCSGLRAAGPGRDRQGWKRKKPEHYHPGALHGASERTGRRTKESPRRAGAFQSEGGQRQDMTDAAV